MSFLFLNVLLLTENTDISTVTDASVYNYT